MAGKRVHKAFLAPSSFRQYKLLPHQKLTFFQAVRRLEDEYPSLSLRVHLCGHEIMLKPQADECTFLLARGLQEKHFGITLDEAAIETKVVVLRYPFGTTNYNSDICR